METITSRQNPLFQTIRKLNTSAAFRRQQGLFVCEGPKLLEEAVKWGADIQTVVAAQGYSGPLPGAERTVETPQDVLKSISDTQTPQGVVFTCRLHDTARPLEPTGRRYLVLDGVQDPGNLGTIWRTADAFGADGLILVGLCADPFAPKVVRATMGACFRLPVYQSGLVGLERFCAQAGLPLYATALREDTEDVRSVDLTHAAVVIGSEGRGVSGEMLSLCEKTLKIPMTEKCESLNAAVAAAVVLWEGWRQTSA